MKLRIKGNSLRLRISRSEVTRLLEGDRLEETIRFAPAANARFSYSLRKDPSVTAPTVRYTNNRVEILLPVDRAKTWGLTDEVGIAEDICLGDLGSLALLIEKDFACLDRSDEDRKDTFPNPNAGATC
jgi:uncharacterized protein DUF7009